jgi:ABC-type lipoprotein export system ATPase subunit
MSGLAPPVANPFVGPRAFRRGEPLYGRDNEMLDLVDLLIAERVVLVYSPSGAGKTSLIQAALIRRSVDTKVQCWAHDGSGWRCE